MYANSQRVLQNEKAGFKTFIWQTVGDNRVRSQHAELDGKIFTWEDGADGSFPSQPIACRCSAEVNEDEVFESVKLQAPLYDDGLDLLPNTFKDEKTSKIIKFSSNTDILVSDMIINRVKIQLSESTKPFRAMFEKSKDELRGVYLSTEKYPYYNPKKQTLNLKENDIASNDKHELGHFFDDILNQKLGYEGNLSFRLKENISEKDVTKFEVVVNNVFKKYSKDDKGLNNIVEKYRAKFGNDRKYLLLEDIIWAVSNGKHELIGRNPYYIQNPNISDIPKNFMYSENPIANGEVFADMCAIISKKTVENSEMIQFIKENFSGLFESFKDTIKGVL